MNATGEVIPLFAAEEEHDADDAAALAEAFLLMRNLPSGDYRARALADLRAIAADPRLAGLLSAGRVSLRGGCPYDVQDGAPGRLVGGLE